ncbi:hypothetical protein BRADI_3g57013v3 [Brachypodium distachyon]|uniref:Uncharacterized protein n=1 Tax=Brachypodium distachyon TaxID=15368 RepID=A0A0Q3FRB0_BRADI|nr:hypothetical protein BRADI_3g57013v3 [Brachypodium distachyon]
MMYYLGDFNHETKLLFRNWPFLSCIITECLQESCWINFSLRQCCNSPWWSLSFSIFAYSCRSES